MIHLPYELGSTIVGLVEPQSWSQILLANKSFRRLFDDPQFWHQQCVRRCYQGTTREDFRRAWCTARNWSLGRYYRRDLPTQGHVCYVLDGAGRRAVGAPVGPEGVARMWDLQTGKWILRCAQEVCAAALEDDVLICGLRDGTILQRDIREGRNRELVIGGHFGEVSVVALQGGRLVSGSYDGVCKVWDLRQSHAAEERPLDSPVTAVAVSRDGRICAGGTVSGALHVFGGGGEEGRVLATAGGAVNCLEFCWGKLYAGSDDGCLRIIGEAGKVEETLGWGFTSPIVSMHHTRERMLTGHSNGLITCQDRHHRLATKRDPLYIAERRGIIWKLWANDDHILASSLDERLSIHDFKPAR